ncbi:MAG: TetR/AcrR family transcriptional regulator [Bacillota bacterium]|nr:TetR/AcrR family transcriptional regulator [Bacillota bacterium]
MEKKIRIPTQKRALDKIDKIVDAAFKLFNEKGYYNTTTVDIANEAKVATGSVYSYFKDKKEIYIQVMKRIDEKFDDPTREFWLKNKIPFDNAGAIKELFGLFLKLMLSHHNFSKTFHDEMEALRLIDEDIRKVHLELDEQRFRKTKEIFDFLNLPFKSQNDEDIFLHYSIFLIDDLCHTILYENAFKNTDLCTERCSHMLYSLFEVTTIRQS